MKREITSVKAASKVDTTKKKRATGRTPTHDEVASMAYFLWQNRGGSETDNWLEAEKALGKRKP